MSACFFFFEASGRGGAWRVEPHRVLACGRRHLEPGQNFCCNIHKYRRSSVSQGPRNREPANAQRTSHSYTACCILPTHSSLLHTILHTTFTHLTRTHFSVYYLYTPHSYTPSCMLPLHSSLLHTFMLTTFTLFTPTHHPAYYLYTSHSCTLPLSYLVLQSEFKVTEAQGLKIYVCYRV